MICFVHGLKPPFWDNDANEYVLETINYCALLAGGVGMLN